MISLMLSNPPPMWNFHGNRTLTAETEEATVSGKRNVASSILFPIRMRKRVTSRSKHRRKLIRAAVLRAIFYDRTNSNYSNRDIRGRVYTQYLRSTEFRIGE